MIRNQKIQQAILVVIVFIIVTSIWEIGVILSKVPQYILPPPSKIAGELVKLIIAPHFWSDFLYTMLEVFLGYFLAVFIAAILGIAISQIRALQMGLMPYVVAFQTIPTIALAPIFLQLFGYGIESKIIMAAIIAFFPMLINFIAGLQSAGKDEIQMLKSFGATHLQVLLKIKVPNSLPFVFAGLGLGIVFALIGAIVAEFVGAQRGLGKLILQFNEQFNIAGMFAVLIILSVLGMIMHGIVDIIKRRVVFWSGEH